MEVDGKAVGQIDEALYSRQLYVLGKEAMHKMTSCDVLVVGMRGLGIEVAKNVVLAGVRSVTLCDDEPAVVADLGSNFFLHAADVGQPRAKVCAKRLAELNNYVAVRALEGGFSADAVRDYSVVVMTDQPLSAALKVNAACHAASIPFISAETLGIMGSVFCDFGDAFAVSDPTGEEPLSVLVSSISRDEEGLVTTHDEHRHGFEDGDHVTFSEVQGMAELVGCAPVKIAVKGPYAFAIGDTSKHGAYTGGGYAHQVKMPVTISHKPLAAALQQPSFLDSDFAKLDRPAQLHALSQALSAFRDVRPAERPAPGAAAPVEARPADPPASSPPRSAPRAGARRRAAHARRRRTARARARARQGDQRQGGVARRALRAAAPRRRRGRLRLDRAALRLPGRDRRAGGAQGRVGKVWAHLPILLL